MLRRAVNVGSLDLIWRANYGLGLYYARDYEASIEEYLKVLEIDPDYPWAYNNLASSYMALGRDDDAYRAWLRAWERSYRESGLDGAFRHWLQTDTERAKTEYVDPVELAQLNRQLGELDAAFEWLERAYEEHTIAFVWVIHNPMFDSLQSDTRFQDLRRRMNFPEAS